MLRGPTLGPCEAALPQSDLHDPFSLYELHLALGACNKRMSPGPDGISYAAMLNLGPQVTATFLKMFSRIWEKAQLPDSRKTAGVVPLL